MRVYVPYSCASAPHGSMLIGWLGHKRRKLKFPVAHTVLPVFWGGEKGKWSERSWKKPCSSPGWQPLRCQVKPCFLESSLLINRLLLQIFKLIFFKCTEYLNIFLKKTWIQFLPIHVTRLNYSRWLLTRWRSAIEWHRPPSGLLL